MFATRSSVAARRGGFAVVGAAVMAFLAVALSSAEAATTDYLDPSFGTAGVVSLPEGGGAAEAPDGSLIVASTTGTDYRVRRFSADGVPDPSFAGGSGVGSVDLGGPASLYSMLIQSDGRILVSGSVNRTTCGPFFCSFRYDLTVVRFNANGTLDTTWGAGGVSTPAVHPFATFNTIGGLAEQPGGQIVATTWESKVLRLDPDGQLDVRQYDQFGNVTDPGFGPDGTGYSEPLPINDLPYNSNGTGDVLILPDSSILVLRSGGQASNSALMRLTPSGSVDTLYGGDGRVEVPLCGLVISLDGFGRVLVSGGTTDWIQTSQGLHFARYLAGGVPDVSFGVGGVSSFAVGDASMAGATDVDGAGRI